MRPHPETSVILSSILRISIPCILLILLTANFNVRGQCNTTLNKLLPEASVNNDDRLGSALAANGQYMVVAAESSDTLGILYAGAVFVFEKTVAGWSYRAMLTASDPDEYDFFGNRVAIDATGNTIVVINRNYNKGGAYIFEMPASGWETMHETANIKFPEYLEFNSALDISDDGATIAVSNPMTNHAMLFVLEKPVTGWSSSQQPHALEQRQGQQGIWLGSDVTIQDDYIYATTSNEGNPSIFVYKKMGGDYSKIAQLATSLPASELGHFGEHITLLGNTIVATGLAFVSGSITQRFFVFRKSGEWTDMNETAQFQLSGLWSDKFPYSIALTSPKTIAAAMLIKEGEYYTGKVVEATTTDGSWQDLSVTTLFEEKGLWTPSEFSNDLVWNGSDLMMAAVEKSAVFGNRNSILSMTKSGGLWGSLQHVSLPRNSSSNMYFGTSIVKTPEVMFAGAPYDGTAGFGAGAVYIYERSGEDYVKMHTIYPSRRTRRSGGGSDAAFGYSIAVHGDEIAVGAPSFLYAPGHYGKIFLYRRTSSSWKTATLYDSLIVPVDLDLNHVGATVAMNDHLLFASAYNNLGGAHTNAVAVFEKVGGKWTYKQLITLGKPLDKSWPSVNLSLENEQLAVGEFFTLGGGVSIFNRNVGTAQWAATASFSGDVFSGMGGGIKLLGDHLFIGAPGKDHNNVYRSGEVLVYTKLPGESWRSDMQPSAVIAPDIPIEGAFFGSSLDAIGNTLVVGAPGMFLTFDSKVRTIPGNTYVIQTSDYFWVNTVQYLNLQGDRYASNERDHFGSYVALDQEYFYIGARSENTDTGKFSGAVYYVPTPPVIFLQPPVCAQSGPISLQGYPFGGKWSGQGVDESGKFDPATVGIGVFTLTYTTLNCNKQGTVQIEVKPPVIIQQLSPADVTMCSEGSVELELKKVPGAIFTWYYRPEGATTFVLLTSGTEKLSVTNPGEYKAVVSSECSAESPLFRISIENFPVTVGPQPIICSPANAVSLVVSNKTGVWEGAGVSNNQFNPSGLANGFHALTYRITTSLGCRVALKDSIKISVVAPVTVTQQENDFCETGSVLLRSSPSNSALGYTWYYKETQSGTFTSVNSMLAGDVPVYVQGYYQTVATNGECSTTSNIIEVGFGTNLSYELSDALKPICNAKEFTIVVSAREGTTYTWQHQAIDGNGYQVLDGQTSDRLTVSEDGYYKVKGEYGFCSFDSSPALIQFAQDTLFVPNIFTPNGDDKNPVFRVETTATINSLVIYNRYGDQIFLTSSGQWDGGDAPSGVYYWRLLYEGCDSEKESKGWVHLVR
ncbi:gliding motility-associated C-terminal domain-containing protein [Chryseolinea serpens]|uniref:Gliding motility-associated C-terminal domain-containing protein n=1 Tax=Chryseolinea serpens TaxID=947013 RepID=A0A1M5JW29_9BACT|nr:gliding motility-associated C-terminal domain-containing protein [Chryseolinea serpens]SHG44746.1 gliding motility-associated C-terminal domain-containing protein [Chryseolinea serpens]